MILPVLFLLTVHPYFIFLINTFRPYQVQPEQPEPDGLSVDYAKEAAKELGSRLGRGCRIVTGRKKGRIELEYYGVEDLNQLLDALHALKTK